METQIETLDAATSTMTLSLDVGLYPRDVLYAAAYVFLDRAYVLLDRDGARFLVHLRGKQPLDEATLRAMAGEFANELLAQALRHQVVKANQRIIEDITSLAIAGAAGGIATSGDDAADGLLIDMQDPGDDGFLDDPLGIATPWEKKKDRRVARCPSSAAATPQPSSSTAPCTCTTRSPKPRSPSPTSLRSRSGPRATTTSSRSARSRPTSTATSSPSSATSRSPIPPCAGRHSNA